MVVVSLAAIVTEHFLLERGLLVAAIVVAALAVAARWPSSRPFCGGSARSCEAAEGRRDRQAGPAHSPDHPLSICGLLAAGADWVEFAALRHAAGISDSVLSKQSRVLEDAGYVEVRKGAVGRRPRTWFRLTAEGRQAVEASGLAGPAGGGCLRQHPGCAAGEAPPW